MGVPTEGRGCRVRLKPDGRRTNTRTSLFACIPIRFTLATDITRMNVRRVASNPPIGGPVDVEHWTGRTQADLAAECDAIRAERGLPDFLLNALLDDMAVLAARLPGFSCDYRRKIGLARCGSCEDCIRAQEPDRQVA